MNSDSSCDRTSEGVARAAGELLKTARSKKVRRVAGSALRNRRGNSKRGSKRNSAR